MRYGDDYVEDDDTDKYDGFETLCRGASDRLGLGWTNRQPNTWAWRAQCRTRFSICCSRTGGARLLSSSTRFLCALVEIFLIRPNKENWPTCFVAKEEMFLGVDKNFYQYCPPTSLLVTFWPQAFLSPLSFSGIGISWAGTWGPCLIGVLVVGAWILESFSSRSCFLMARTTRWFPYVFWILEAAVIRRGWFTSTMVRAGTPPPTIPSHRPKPRLSEIKEFRFLLIFDAEYSQCLAPL